MSPWLEHQGRDWGVTPAPTLGSGPVRGRSFPDSGEGVAVCQGWGTYLPADEVNGLVRVHEQVSVVHTVQERAILQWHPASGARQGQVGNIAWGKRGSAGLCQQQPPVPSLPSWG